MLETPVTGGKVSLYNENPQGAIHPTPTIGMVGLVESLAHVTPSAFQQEGDEIVLLGECTDELGASEYLLTVHGLTIGEPPVCDPAVERRLIDALLESIGAGVVRSAHDCSDGGLAVAVAEMAIASGQGVKSEPNIAGGPRRDAAWFGEAPSRILLAVPNDHYERALSAHLPSPARLTPMGLFGGDVIRLGNDADILVTEAERAFESALRD